MARGRRGAYKAEKRKKELNRMAKKEAKKKRRLGNKPDDAGIPEVAEVEAGSGESLEEPQGESAESP